MIFMRDLDSLPMKQLRTNNPKQLKICQLEEERDYIT